MRSRCALTCLGCAALATAVLLGLACSKEAQPQSPPPRAASAPEPAPAVEAPPAQVQEPVAAQPETTAPPAPQAAEPPPAAATSPAQPTAPEANPAEPAPAAPPPAVKPSPAEPPAPPPSTHAPVGSEKCKMCHRIQYESWAASKHGMATPKVECETCHGNGADYMKMSVMKDRAQALAAGMILPDKLSCATCHKGGVTDAQFKAVHAHKAK